LDLVLIILVLSKTSIQYNVGDGIGMEKLGMVRVVSGTIIAILQQRLILVRISTRPVLQLVVTIHVLLNTEVMY